MSDSLFPRLSIIVPFHRNLAQLRACLGALSATRSGTELIVVADGALESCHELVGEHGGRVIEVDGPRGPAVARNRGAAQASGDVLLFIDTDVVAAPDALIRLREAFRARPGIAAIFGAYDEHPADPGFMSQYKNLSHSYFHQASRREARTFWAGLGAVRRDAFESIGGFDERFARPSVEDIEFGYRLSSQGFKILLEPGIRGCHLKRWTLRSAVVTDVRDRGIPWTQLMLQFSSLDNDLNLRVNQRVAVALSYLLLLSLALTALAWVWLWVALVLLFALAALNLPYYTFFLQRRGVWFVSRVFPVHLLHHLCNGFSFVAGSAVHYATSRTLLQLPGALPVTRWPPSEYSGGRR